MAEAYPAAVSDYLVQQLIASYSKRSNVQRAPLKYLPLISPPKANPISSFASQYTEYGNSVVKSIEGLKLASDVISVFPGGRTGLVNELSDMFSYIGRFDPEDAKKKLSNIQNEILSAAQTALQNRQTQLQNTINYYSTVAKQDQQELPYGMQWIIETATANVYAQYPAGTITRANFDTLYRQENQRLQALDAERERAQEQYQKQYDEFSDLGANAQKYLQALVSALISAVQDQIALLQGINKTGYCTFQGEQTETYKKTIESFNQQVESALDAFNSNDTIFWSQLDITAICQRCPDLAGINNILSAMQQYGNAQESVLGTIITALQDQISSEGGIAKTSYVPGFNYTIRTEQVQEQRTAIQPSLGVSASVPTIPTTEQAESEFGTLMKMLETQFGITPPTSQDIETITNAVDALDRASRQQGANTTQIATWRTKLNGWLKTALNAGEKVYFAPVKAGFGESPSG